MSTDHTTPPPYCTSCLPLDEFEAQRAAQADSGKAMRFNDGKSPLVHLTDFPFAMAEFAANCEGGAKKYDLGNFRKGAPTRELLSCLLRHTFELAAGSDRDVDGVHHAAKIMWNAAAIIENSYWNPDGDDRLKFDPDIAAGVEKLLTGELKLGDFTY